MRLALSLSLKDLITALISSVIPVTALTDDDGTPLLDDDAATFLLDDV